MLSYKGSLERVSRGSLVTGHKALLYTLVMKSGLDLKALREASGLTQKQVAEKLGLKTSQAISEIERSGSVPKQHAESLSILYGVPIARLLSPRSTGAVNESLTNLAKASPSESGREGTKHMLFETIEELTRLKVRIEQLERNFKATRTERPKPNPQKPRKT